MKDFHYILLVITINILILGLNITASVHVDLEILNIFLNILNYVGAIVIYVSLFGKYMHKNIFNNLLHGAAILGLICFIFWEILTLKDSYKGMLFSEFGVNKRALVAGFSTEESLKYRRITNLCRITFSCDDKIVTEWTSNFSRNLIEGDSVTIRYCSFDPSIFRITGR